MSAPIEIYVASFNTRLYTELCVRSLHASADHPFRLTVGDSGSRDGSAELLAQLATDGWLELELSRGPRRHSAWLDGWLAGATARRVLFCDSDIEFRRPGLLGEIASLAERTGAAIVTSEVLPADHYEDADEGITTHLMSRPAPWLMMVDADALRPLQISFEKHTEPCDDYPEGSRTFDVGARLYHEALARGLGHAVLPRRARRSFRHYVGASWRTVRPVGRLRRRTPLDVVQRSLTRLREAQPAPSRHVVAVAGPDAVRVLDAAGDTALASR